MKRSYLIILGCIATSMLHAQELSGQYTTEWQWDMNKNTNWVNQLRLDLSIPLGSDRNTIEAATLHLAKTGESVIGDWQGFSNIDADNMLAVIAVLGFMHQWNSGHLFIGVRNVNEDFFTSPITALFTNSSCGIFPTVAASYPIANYPFSGLTLYFDITRKGWTFRNSLYNGTGYNGWTAHDNPFLIKPKTDGIFNMSQIEYTHRSGEYYAGIAVHTRQQPFVTEDETASTMTQTNGTSVNGTTTDENTPNKTSTDENSLARTTFAWWLYGEQKLWTSGEKNILCMVQYSPCSLPSSSSTTTTATSPRSAPASISISDGFHSCLSTWATPVCPSPRRDNKRQPSRAWQQGWQPMLRADSRSNTGGTSAQPHHFLPA